MAASSSSSLFSRYFPKAHSTYTRYSASPAGRGVAWSWKNRRPIFIGVSIAYFGASYLVVKQQATRRDTIHPNTYLVWKFYPGSIVEVRGSPSLSYLLGSSSAGEEPPKIMELHEAVRALKLAANDPRVRGMLGDFSTLNWPSNIQSEGLGLAQIEELMQAIYEFKIAKDAQFPAPAQLAAAVEDKPSPASSSTPSSESSSEPSVALTVTTSAITSSDAQDRPAPYLPSTIAFCDTFTSQSSYLLASAFDKVYLQPSGNIPLTGVSAQIPFFSRLISKLGIKVHTEARREYKSMISQFKEKDGLPPLQAHNEAQLLGELNRSVAYAIGSNRFRGMDGDGAADKVVELMGKGPYSAKEALQLGLVDGLKYKGEVITLLTGQDAGGDIGDAKKNGEAPDDPNSLKFKTLPHYARVTDRLVRSKLNDDEIVDIAICYLRGSISAAPGDFSASTVVKGLQEAAKDDSIKAIVLRIDSGGGDVVASDSIWHAVRRAKESSGKPIIVSFGNVAASGGYYAATAADAIYASETTVTGSIGVASIRPTITRKLFDWAGVGLQTFFTGSKAQSLLHDMDEEQLKRETQHIDETYEDFLSKVVQGRKIERSVIEDIAGGRVFTGLVAWTKTNPDALEAAEKEREMQRTDSGKSKAGTSLIEEVEEVLGLSKLEVDEPATIKGDKRGGDNSSSPTKFKPSDGLAEWELQDVTKKGELDTKLVVMKARKKVPAHEEEGAVEQVIQGAQGVASKLQEVVLSSKDEVSSASSSASSAAVDPAEAAHREALVANGAKSEKEEQDLAARRAQESEVTSSPYGAGLVDAIGGLSDAAVLAMTLAIQGEINSLMAEQGLTRDAAMSAVRPGCPREIDSELGSISLSADMRLIRYPRERSFRERLREMNVKGDEPSLSLGGVMGTIQNEVGGMMAKSFLTFLGENPGAFLREAAMRMEAGARKEEEEMRRVKMEYGGVGGHARL